jgi:hypothetical protein
MARKGRAAPRGRDPKRGFDGSNYYASKLPETQPVFLQEERQVDARRNLPEGELPHWGLRARVASDDFGSSRILMDSSLALGVGVRETILTAAEFVALAALGTLCRRPYTA